MSRSMQRGSLVAGVGEKLVLLQVHEILVLPAREVFCSCKAFRSRTG